jgi:ABC-2 type transport system ATP-binding protein
MAACIEARQLRKTYGATTALAGIDMNVEEGRILGLIGPNGAGKSTALGALLGLVQVEGHLRVLGLDPWTQRDRLMREASFIADVAVMPRWLRVSEAFAFMAGVHPRFDRAKAQALVARTAIRPGQRVGELSKGMVTQLHLALVMAIDARLLVLDEPTLGLDLLFRKQFYDTLLNDYYDQRRTIIVTTHQVEEIEHILTDVAFIDRGRIILTGSMEDLEARWSELVVRPEQLLAARALGPVHERRLLGRSALLFDGVDRGLLAGLGELRTPGLADLFVALVGAQAAPLHAQEGVPA